MKLKLFPPFKDNLWGMARKIGYIYQRESENGEKSFVRPFERSGYPRFHLYITQSENLISLNLHLDQKRPVYKGAPAHSGEYEGKIVEEEMERIKKILK